MKISSPLIMERTGCRGYTCGHDIGCKICTTNNKKMGYVNKTIAVVEVGVEYK